ncbi:MAG: hypothetical protein IT234_00955 [Bacteroidia bacterium]|nr:hypothetical protein [Bacteroidia bacterium]
MNRTSTKKTIEILNEQMNERADDDKNYPHEPESNIIKNILNYSKALSVRKSKNIEHIELVLN